MKRIPPSIYKFLVSGGIATIIDFACYIVLLKIFWPSIAKSISILMANVWSYMVNKHWVFSTKKDTDSKMIGSYIMVQVLNLAINVGVNSLMLYLTGYVVLSFILATICATTVNYTLQKLYVFK